MKISTEKMMSFIEPELSLALSLSNSPGIYVPLVGSGISRSADILTGWDITLDLIRQVARLMSEDCEPHPDKWFVSKFQREPNYSDLLEELGKTPSERQGLLRKYFEPTEEERLRNEKVPQKGHKAIASLIKGGFIRLVVTTNFDRLLEKACEDMGIVPTVISKDTDIDGAKPFHQTECTIIKIHGDYLDTRIRNSEKELSKYTSPMDLFLDRIFDEHGLIICGWSAQWDHALRDAILRCKGRRYQTYWVKRGAVTPLARRVIDNRSAVIIDSESGDSFFQNIDEYVASLKESSRAHPLTVKAAIATMKRLIPDEKNEIRINDLVLDEVNNIFRHIDKIDPERQGRLLDRFAKYNDLMEKLRAMIITLAQWDRGIYLPLLQKVVERFSKPLREYPSILLLYSIWLACTATRKYKLLGEILKTSRFKSAGREGELCCEVYPHEFSDQINREIDDAKRRVYTPLNDSLFNLLKEHLIPITLTEENFDQAFQEFEYIYGLASCHFFNIASSGSHGKLWGPPGRFLWQKTYRVPDRTTDFSQLIFGKIFDVVAVQLVASALFSSLDNLFEIKKGYDEMQLRIRFEWR